MKSLSTLLYFACLLSLTFSHLILLEENSNQMIIDRIAKLPVEELRNLIFEMEMQLNFNKKEVMEKLENMEKEGIIEFLTKSYGANEKFKIMLMNLKLLKLKHLRQFAVDIEVKKVGDKTKAYENLHNAEKSFIVEYIKEKYNGPDHLMVEDFLNNYMKNSTFVSHEDEESLKKVNSEPESIEVDNFLQSMPKDKLIELAYKIEKYYRKKLGFEKFLGGLEDYIWKMNEDQIRKVIREQLKSNSELNVEKLNAMMQEENESHSFLLISDFFTHVDKSEKKVKIEKPIRELLKFSTKEELIEIIHKIMEEIDTLMPQYLQKINFDHMSNKKLKKIIKKLIRNFPEKLNKFEIYKINQNFNY